MTVHFHAFGFHLRGYGGHGAAFPAKASSSKRCDAWACWGARGAPRTSHQITRLGITRLGARSLHIVVVRILADIADIQNDRLGAEVLPPMRCAEHLGSDIAGFVPHPLCQLAAIF